MSDHDDGLDKTMPQQHLSTPRVLFLGSLCVTLAGAIPAAAQFPMQPKEETPDHDPVEELLAERQTLAARMATLAETLQLAASHGRNAEANALTKELETLEQLDELKTELLTTIERGTELDAERRDLEERLQAAARGEAPEPPPYSLALLDRLREQLDAEEKRLPTLEAAQQAASETLNQSQRALDDSAREMHSKERGFAANGDPNAELPREVAESKLHLEVAEARGDLGEHELSNEKRSRRLHDVTRKLLAQRIAWARRNLEIEPADIEKMMIGLEKEAFALRNDLNTAKLELNATEREFRVAESKLDGAAGPDDALVEEVAAHRLALLARQQGVSLLGERLERLESAKETWRRRFTSLEGRATNEELTLWRSDAETTGVNAERQARLEAARLSELRTTRRELRTKLEREGGSAGRATPWLKKQDEHLVVLIEMYEIDLMTLEATRQLNRWFLAEINEQIASPHFFERMRGLLDAAGSIWHYRLTTIEKAPITVGTLVSAFLLFFLGFVASKFLSRMLGRRLLPRFGLHHGASAALEKLTFYLLFLFCALFALRTINIPLTVFTVVGGALAIGVGFGSQNIVNNFISGLILLIEQPIKVDDLIEVDGTYGKVEQIGARSTVVRSFANIHMIVPNSAFLEKSVVNWTLSDDLIRTQVDVGVAYGSPTREVSRLIHQAIDEHRSILKRPEPLVFFAEFGDNALLFEAYIWIRIATQTDRRRVESDLRFRIDELFRNNQIAIAFPQRDIHLDTVKPLEIKLIDRPDQKPSS